MRIIFNSVRLDHKNLSLLLGDYEATYYAVVTLANLISELVCPLYR